MNDTIEKVEKPKRKTAKPKTASTSTVVENGVKRRVWSDEYKALTAAKRREKYAKNKEYRDTVKAKSRQAYVDGVNPAVADRPGVVRANIANIDKFGSVREVYVALASVGEEFCLTEREMGEVIGIHPQSFNRMVVEERWPRSIFSTRTNKTKTGVYLREEAVAMAEVFADHLVQSTHYYSQHTETTKRLFAACKAARDSTKLGQWAQTMMQP